VNDACCVIEISGGEEKSRLNWRWSWSAAWFYAVHDNYSNCDR